MLGTGLVAGAALGASTCVLAATLIRPRRSLLSAVRRYDAVSDRRGQALPRRRERAGRAVHLALVARGLAPSRLAPDLAILDRTAETHTVALLVCAVGGLVAPALLATALAAVGAGVPVVVPALGCLLAAGAVPWVAHQAMRERAAERRGDLRRALASYLDLVAMSLAGGRGVPEAVPAAAAIGSGWAFGLLQDTVGRARYVGQTPWAALAELGRRVGVPELEDLGGALLLVADDGAKIRTSLAARASTQRRRQLAESEGEAARADQSIQLAQVVLAVGFFLFLGYPAVVAVLGL